MTDKAIWICPECGRTGIMTFPSAYVLTRDCNHGFYNGAIRIFIMAPVNDLARYVDAHIEEWKEGWRKELEARVERQEYDHRRLAALRGDRPSLVFGK